jgi:transcriptional regulator with XRE-family HTH domain
MNRFAELLRAERTRAGLSQQALGKKVGVTNSYISKMERGALPPPSRAVALKLADALGFSDEPKRFAFLLAANAASAEEVQGIAVLPAGQPGQQSTLPGAVFHSPLAISHQEVLRHRLAVLGQRFEVIAKNLREADEELHELQALAAEMFSQE